MNHLYFFDIPVYRISQEEYHQQMAKAKTEQLSDREEFFKCNPKYRILHEAAFSKSFGGMWRYNEIIGFIRLHILGTQVRGEYFTTDSKRIVKTRKKQFIYRTHKLAIEEDIPWGASSQEIYEIILVYLENCKKELSRRTIDTSNFETIGPFVDWGKLIQNSA